VIWEALSTFVAVFFVDVFYTYYLKSIQNEKALQASIWAVVVYLVGCYAVISYIDNHWLLLPAAAGAFCGTFVGMRVRSK
jgi:uncharacterized protein YebE (UPF0316 family)